MEYTEATYLKLGNFSSLEALYENYYKHTSIKLVLSAAKRGLCIIAWITQVLSDGLSTIKSSARRLERKTLDLN